MKKLMKTGISVLGFGAAIFGAFEVSNLRLSATAEPTNGNVISMLKVISQLRSGKELTLSCEKYLDRYLGHSDSIDHYVEQFARHGIHPIRVLQNHKHWVYFELPYAELKRTPNSRFWWSDLLGVYFVTENEEANSPIKHCHMKLQSTFTWP